MTVHGLCILLVLKNAKLNCTQSAANVELKLSKNLQHLLSSEVEYY